MGTWDTIIIIVIVAWAGWFLLSGGPQKLSNTFGFIGNMDQYAKGQITKDQAMANIKNMPKANYTYYRY